MSLLEGRADAKARNGKLEQALDDGNRMLAVEKTNPMVFLVDNNVLKQGYYLLGSLLQTKKKPMSGLKCYAYGLEQCADTHPKYKVIPTERHPNIRLYRKYT
jgi:electron transfer flavoprotein alpha/beta subunit